MRTVVICPYCKSPNHINISDGGCKEITCDYCGTKFIVTHSGNNQIDTEYD